MNSYYKPNSGQRFHYMTRHTLPSVVAVLALAGSAMTLADTDEPPLYVGPAGLDSGNCLDASSPCQTLDFALQRVGKNGRINIAAGTYTLSNPGDVFYLVSGAIDVRAAEGASLIGVPHEFASDLAARGFRVIADAKGLSRETADKLAGTLTAVSTNTPATACVGGSAAGFPCDNVDLHAHIADRTASSRGADIWGFVDLNTNREYAIMGYSTGTAVYDVTDPANPREVGFVDGQRTTWRDIKVYQFWNAADNRWNAYAYVTADNASDGLFVLDLTRLPHRITRASYPSDFAEAHNVYISKTDFSTGLALNDDTPLLVIAGSNLSDGRFRLYSLNNPASPSFIAAPATPADQPGGNRLYMHDAASMTVTDARKDTQCANAGATAYCDVLLDFNESTLDIWDITNPGNPVRLSQTPYNNASYSHSGWWSEDQQYVFLQDELDERDRGLATTLRVFSIADLGNPTLAGAWTGPTRAIDHNGFARGNRYYMSNYARGLTILDISNPANPTTVGRFDTFPSSDSTGFPGAWGTYPFLPSGNILISDIDSGFYIVEDNTRDVIQGSLSFAAGSFAADESQAASITVQRLGGSTGAIAVNWEVFGANGSLADVSVASGTLNWAAGDATDKVISLGLNNDGVAEGLERLIIKLTAPGGGATLSSPSLASVYVSDPGSTSEVGFAADRISVTERGFGMAVAVIQRSGSAAGAASVTYAVTGGDAAAGGDYSGPASGTLNWADGDADPKWIEYEIADDGAGEPDEFIELTLSSASGAALGANASLRIDLLDGTGSNAAPNAVAGASQTVATGTLVTLNGSSSNDPDGDALTYLWTQTMGPTVTLNNATASSASFTAPTVTSDTLLRFNLAVTDPDGLNDSAVTAVTVTANAPGIGGGGGGGGAISLWLLALLLLERMRLDNRLFAIRSR
jgi:choice-of-anchor B domain-containing protein